MSLRGDALDIARAAIGGALPYENTLKALREMDLNGPVTVFAVGKAAVPMARAAVQALGDRLVSGLLVTKYGHLQGFGHDKIDCMEAAHPVSDHNSVLAAEKAMALARTLTDKDTALFLISGGGSALMEKSRVSPEVQRAVTQKLLSRGAPIEAVNAVRRRLSLVKGGKLGALCAPAGVVTLALSDVISNDPGVIASGLSVPDETPDETVLSAAKAYLPDMPELLPFLQRQAPPKVNTLDYVFVGDINLLCEGAKREAEALGYEARIVDRALTGEAREAAVRITGTAPRAPGKRAWIYAGETTVTLKGTGRGGRNQEMALAAAIRLRGENNVCFISVGSDGTDGPTDAAGGIADGESYDKMKNAGVDPEQALENNDSYRALQAAGDLVITGPTGTNVNDLTVLLTEE